jgi:murein DD-endopeptidase MepM/ murein hydrolase activator NlpD
VDRFREFFDNAMLRARPPGDPTGTGFVIPQMPAPQFPIPQPMPFIPQLPSMLGGMGGFGSTGYASLGAPLSVRGTQAQATTSGGLGPSLTDIQQRKKTGATTTTGTGAAGGSASAVAASGPLPTHSGPAPAGTRDTVLRWLPQVTEVARKYDVPPELVLAVMQNESGGDPKAQSPYNPGQGYARGLMQVMPFHFTAGEDPFDVATNLDKGVKLLASGYHKYGNSPDHAMATFFGGPGAIDSNGNIRTNLSDVNISIGNYITQKFRPAYAAYQNYMRGLGTSGLRDTTATQPAPQAANGPADLADLWGWLGGSRHPVTGKFGEQDGPYPGTGHRGMDIGTPAGTALTSPIAGTVIAAGDVGGGYGNQVRIQTAYGSVLLGHLASVNVKRGQQIAVGTPLGVTGSTGKSTGPHLHVELRDPNDNAIDPARYYRW